MATLINDGTKVPPLKIATFGAPLSGNKGSASMLIGLFDAMRRENVDFRALVYSYYPKRDAREAQSMENVEVRAGHPIHLVRLLLVVLLGRYLGNLAPARLRQEYEELASCHVVGLVGGTTFADSMLYKSPWNLLAALPAMLAGRPFVFLSQTMGPFQKAPNRWMARFTLGRAAAIHARGARSEKLVHDIGLTSVVYRPDLSLGMNVAKIEDLPRANVWIERARGLKKTPSARLVGVTPNTIVAKLMEQSGKSYASLMAEVVDGIAARGCVPVLIPHSYRPDSAGSHNNDASLCEAIIGLSTTSKAGILYVKEDLTSEELRALVGELDLLVASRFHSMVSALVVGTPVVTIGWGDQKYIEVLEAFDQTSDLYVPYQEATAERVLEKIDAVERTLGVLKERSRAALARNRALLSDAIRELQQFAQTRH